MRCIDADALIAEYDRVHVGAPGGARKLMVDAPTIEPEQRWIPVTERLPPKYGYYLVTKTTRNAEIKKGYEVYTRLSVETYTKMSHWGKSTCGITAWMPLPEPYREEGDA